jgi:hypothetical protein
MASRRVAPGGGVPVVDRERGAPSIVRVRRFAEIRVGLRSTSEPGVTRIVAVSLIAVPAGAWLATAIPSARGCRRQPRRRAAAARFAPGLRQPPCPSAPNWQKWPTRSQLCSLNAPLSRTRTVS